MRDLSFNFRKYTVYLLGLFGILVASCSKGNETIPVDGGTATIRLNIPAIEASSRINTPTEEQEKAINNLRVIILSQGAESINKSFGKDELGTGGITIDSVPVGPVQMYVIANEKSLGKEYDTLAGLQGDLVTVGEKRKVLVWDKDRNFFPKRGSEFPAEGLPMEWMNKSLTINPPSVTPQVIDVNLVRTVAKLNIKMNNALSTPITIKEMYFGKFFGNSLYLFHEGELDVPEGDDESYARKDYIDLNIPIEGNKSESLSLYIYPSFAWKNPVNASPYTIGFKTATTTYPPLAFVDNYGTLNAIARNTQVNISATLHTNALIDIKFEVVPWEDNTVEVPSFE